MLRHVEDSLSLVPLLADGERSAAHHRPAGEAGRGSSCSDGSDASLSVGDERMGGREGGAGGGEGERGFRERTWQCGQVKERERERERERGRE